MRRSEAAEIIRCLEEIKAENCQGHVGFMLDCALNYYRRLLDA